MTEQVFIGVDIGGTKIAAGLVNSAGEILYKTRVPMNGKGPAEEATNAVYAAIDDVVDWARARNLQVHAIGVTSPGPLDPRSGIIINPPNLPCWRNYPLAANVERRYSIPTHLDNDANAAALSEALWGAGIGYSTVFCVTLGTGIGSGIVFDKKLYIGKTGNAGEAGHVSINFNGPRCGCGKPGCIEAYAAGPGIALRARQRLAEAPGNQALLRLANGDIEQVACETVADAWREGDPLATEVLRETAELLAIWVGNMIDVLDPDIVVFGGGVSALMSSWFDYIREQLPRWSINPHSQDVPLVVSKYGNDSGVAGAAALCFSDAPQTATV